MTLKEMIAFFKTRPNDVLLVEDDKKLIINFGEDNEILEDNYYIVPNNKKCFEIINEIEDLNPDENAIVTLGNDNDVYGSLVSCFKVKEKPYNSVLVPSLIKSEYQINWDINLKQKVLSIKESENSMEYRIELPFNYMKCKNKRIKISVEKVQNKEYRISDNSYFNFNYTINLMEYFKSISKLKESYYNLIDIESLQNQNSMVIFSTRDSLMNNIFKLGSYVLSLDSSLSFSSFIG